MSLILVTNRSSPFSKVLSIKKKKKKYQCDEFDFPTKRKIKKKESTKPEK